MELTTLTLSAASGLIARREISPFELTRAHLERIESYNPRLNCFLTVMVEDALQRAREAEKILSSKEAISPLCGIPIALKDLFETRGTRTTAGSKFFAGYVPESDAMVVQKLQEAGVVLLGKLNMHEIALGVTNVNPHFGACRNPWKLARVSGGSSGGSGAALAAGLCLGSLGSDTGGSIRIPAALCGVVGLKPTYGRVSLRGVIPLSWNLDHAGPLARRVLDAAMLLQAIAGYDPADPASIQAPKADFLGHIQDGVRGWRIALANDEYFTHIDPEVRKAVEEAAIVFEQLGAQVSRVEFAGARQAALSNGLMTTSDAAAFHSERLRNRPEDFGPDVLQRLQTGAAYTACEYIQARRDQVVLRRQFEDFFSQYEVLLTPTTPVTAPAIEGPDAIEQARRLTRFTAPFNLTGLPAISVPCGFTGEGLPIGLQLVTRPWAEAALLRAGFAYEQAVDWSRRSPRLDMQ